MIQKMHIDTQVSKTEHNKQRMDNVLNEWCYDVSTSGHFQGASSPSSIVDPRHKSPISGKMSCYEGAYQDLLVYYIHKEKSNVIQFFGGISTCKFLKVWTNPTATI